jgi:hypothetical protein
MRCLSCAILLAALSAPVAGLAADQGEVVWVDPSCNHFIAKVGEEFGTYNWRSGAAPQMGDHLEGDLLNLESGAREVTNTTAHGSNTVYIVALGPKLYVMIHTAPVQCKERFRGSIK